MVKFYSHTKKQLVPLLLLALIVFSMYEKLRHELSHLNEKHCSTTTVHFCETEHDCDLCDFIFSSPVEPSKKTEVSFISTENSIQYSNFYESKIRVIANYLFSLKAPPIC